MSEPIEFDDAELEVLASLNARGVKFVVVGSTAAVFHGSEKSPQDLDLAIDAVQENAERVLLALQDLRLEHSWSAADLCRPRQRVQLPLHGVDLLTAVDGVTFEALYRARHTVDTEAGHIGVASHEHVEAMERARGGMRSEHKIQIFVRLMDEGIDCWRPVDAIEERPGWYRIIGPVPDTEHWEFQPSQLVRCKTEEDNSLVAVAPAS